MMLKMQVSFLFLNDIADLSVVMLLETVMLGATCMLI